MAGSIVAKGERTWLVRVFTGRDANGKRIYHGHTVHGTKKDAQTYLNAVLRDRDLGTFVAPAPVTLDEYLTRWLNEAAKPKLGIRTFADYTELLARYVRTPLGGRKLAALAPLDIQGLYTSMLDRGLSPRTVRYTHTVLSSALKQAVRWRMLARNPASDVDLPRKERREMQALSPEQAGRFLDAARDDRLGPLFSFALATGMRPEEYLALQWQDLDPKMAAATVRRVLVFKRGGKGEWSFEEPKTPKSRRTVPLPASVTRELIQHRAKQAEERLKAGPAWQDHGLVFPGENGKPWRSANVDRHFKDALTAAGLSEDVRLYDLRHTCATLLLLAGVNAKVVAERLGHASVTLTLDTYSHVLPTMQQDATDRLEAMLYGRP